MDDIFIQVATLFSKIKQLLSGKKPAPPAKKTQARPRPLAPLTEELFETHYDMLYLAHDASPKLIRSAYIALQLKYHPDRNINSPTAAAMAQLVNAAYQTLSDAEKKAEHDAWIVSKKPKAASNAASKDEKLITDLRAKVAAWKDLHEKAQLEARKAQQQADDAGKRAAVASAAEKDKFMAWVIKARDQAKEAEQKVFKCQAEEKAAEERLAREELGSGGKANTHYATLRINRFAPSEIIEAAYNTLRQEHGGEGDGGFLSVLEAAYQVLSDSQSKKSYDAELNTRLPVKWLDEQADIHSETDSRVRDAQTKADQLAAQVQAAATYAERAAEDVKVAEQRAAEAREQAEKNVNTADAAKWQNWADKMAEEVTAAKKRAQKAYADSKTIENTARDAAATAKAESMRAARVGASDHALAAERRAIRQKAEKELQQAAQKAAAT